ncbi:MAG TPA: hypothetical protein VMZ90_00535 [Vicinamibacterales bacterium]|nr:hypothetical protein [Vicinamibacterales bacterium]
MEVRQRPGLANTIALFNDAIVITGSVDVPIDWQIADCRLADCRLQIADYRFQITDYRLQILLVVFVPVVIDLSIHRGGVCPRDGGRLLVLGRGGGLCLLSGTQRKGREQPVQLLISAGGTRRWRVAVARGSNQYLELVRARLAAIIKQRHNADRITRHLELEGMGFSPCRIVPG